MNVRIALIATGAILVTTTGVASAQGNGAGLELRRSQVLVVQGPASSIIGAGLPLAGETSDAAETPVTVTSSKLDGGVLTTVTRVGGTRIRSTYTRNWSYSCSDEVSLCSENYGTGTYRLSGRRLNGLARTGVTDYYSENHYGEGYWCQSFGAHWCD